MNWKNITITKMKDSQLKFRSKDMKKMIISLMFVFIICLQLTGCANDKMYQTKKDNETIYVFRFGDEFIETGNYYQVDFQPEQQTSDGAFYKIIADVTYHNGGEVGLNNYPEFRNIHSITEVSIDDLTLPAIENKQSGLTKVGDYADVDYCLWSRDNLKGKESSGVYKDGKWLYTYDSSMVGKDGTYICYNNSVTNEQIDSGIKSGIICCEDYFVIPALEKQ